MDFKALVAIMMSVVLVNNYVLSQFLGICPFLGVSNKISTSAGMGMAVIFVMTLSTLVTSLLHNYILIPLNITFIQTICFILIIASLVQMLEIILRKTSPALYQALGVYLPLITTNCAVLGVAISVTRDNLTLIDSVLYTIFTAIGFTIAIIIFSGIREQMELSNIPKGMKGVPISLITAGILAMAFMGFANLV